MTDYSFLLSGQTNENDLATRGRLITTMNRYMAERPDAVQAMAMSGLSNTELIDSAGALYAAEVGDSLRGQLEGMSPASQRAVFNQLTSAQQMAIKQMGYQTPGEDADSLFADIVRPIAGGIGTVVGGVGKVVKPIAEPALDTLTWVGNWPGHLYRTIRLQDGWGQAAAGVFGIIGGIGALALAPTTGGLSLMAAGAFGLGALGAGSAASFAVTSITNPGDWMRAFNASWDGENTFKPDALRRVDEMLGDPRLSGLAQDLAEIDGFTLAGLARETAAARDGGEQRQMAMIEELASRMGGVGTPEFQQAAQTIFNVTQDPTFQEAVRVLQRAKFSPGRDVAGLFGMDPDSTLYRMTSGAVDLMFTVGVDPTLLLGGANKLYKARRFGLQLNEGSTLADVFADVAKDWRVVKRHEQIVDAINRDDIAGLWRMSKSFGREAEQLINYKRSLKLYGELGDEGMTVKQLHEYLVSEAHNVPLLRGVGSTRHADQYVLESYSYLRGAYQQVARQARAFTDGIADAGLLRKIDHLTEGGENLKAMYPAVVRSVLSENGSILRPDLYNQGAPLAYMAGRYLGMTGISRLGEAVTSMTTMALKHPQVNITGPGAVEDIRALTEMARAMNMPSFARRKWADMIIAADSNSTRVNLINGFFDNALTMSGIRELPEGNQLIGEVLERFRHAYGADDFLMINGRKGHFGIFLNQQADAVLMPDFQTLIKAVRAAHMARFLDVLDIGTVEAAMNKVWKPAVLLRLAFIPRAAGEEFLAWSLRGGLGGLVQELSAQGIAKTHVYDAVQRKLALDPHAVLTDTEEWVRRQGPLANIPAYLRPVARMMGRIGWGDPMIPHLETFGRWTRRMMEERPGGAEDRIVGALRSRIGGVPTGPMLPGPRTNLMTNVDALLLGNPYSWRRMILGGVDHDLVRAADQFYSANATSMWRAISATNAGPVDPGHDARNTIITPVEDRKGVMRPVEQVVVRSSPTLRAASNDPLFTTAVHHQTTQATDDVLHKAAMPEIRRIRPESMDEQRIHDILQPLSKVRHHGSRMILREFTDDFNLETWKGMVHQLSKDEPVLARALKLNVAGLKDPDFDEVITGLESAYRDLAKGLGPDSREAQLLDDAVSDLKGVRDTVRSLPDLETNERAFMATQIDDLWNPQNYNYQALQKFVRGESAPSPGPARRLYRGVSTPSQIEVLPNGDLVLIGQQQNHWKPADDSEFENGLGLSFTVDHDHAMEYAQNQGALNINSMVLEVDADVVYGITGEPVKLAAQGFAWTGSGEHPFGAYEIGSRGEVNVNLQDEVLKNDLNDPAVLARIEQLHQQRAALTGWDIRNPVESDEQFQMADNATESYLFQIQQIDLQLKEIAEGKIRSLKQDRIVIPAGKWRTLASATDDGTEIAAVKEALRVKLEKFEQWFTALPDTALWNMAVRDSLDKLDEYESELLRVTDPDVRAVLLTMTTGEVPLSTPLSVVGTPLMRHTLEATANPERVRDLQQMAVAELARRQGVEVNAFIDAYSLDTTPVPDTIIAEARERLFEPEFDELRAIIEESDPDKLIEDLQAYRTRRTEDWDPFDGDDETVTMAFRAHDFIMDNRASMAQISASDILNHLIDEKALAISYARYGSNHMYPIRELKRGWRSGFNRDFAASTPMEFFEKIHGFDRPTEWGSLPPVSPYYNSWEDAAPAIRRRVRDALNNPNNSQSVQHSVRQLAGDDQNLLNAYDSIVKDGTRDLWVVDDQTADMLMGLAWNPNHVTYDRVLSAADTNDARMWVIAHKPLIEETLRTAKDGGAFVSSTSRELISALDRVAGYTDMTNAYRYDRLVMDAELGPAATKWGKDVEVWGLPSPITGNRAVRRTAEQDDRMDVWADLAEARMRQLFTGRTRQGLKPRMRPGERLPGETPRQRRKAARRNEVMDEPGPPQPLVFHDEAQQHPVDPDALITRPGAYYDHKGRLVPNGSLDYFEQGEIAVDPRGQVMWGLYGPASRDADDVMWGRQFYNPQEHVAVRPGMPQPTRDVVPAYRSRLDDVSRVGADELPNYAIGETLTMKKRGGWDRFVEFGFDRVIGPALDSIIRNPMAFHHYSRRFIEARKAMTWLLRPELEAEVVELGRTISVLSVPTGVDGKALPRQIRDIARFDGLADAKQWNDGQVMAWMRGLSPAEFDELTERTLTRSLAGLTGPELQEARLAKVAARQLQKHDPEVLLAATHAEQSFDEVLSYVENLVPSAALESWDSLQRPQIQELIRKNPVLSQLTGKQWGAVIDGIRIRNQINTSAGEFAQIASIDDIVPFLDSHEFKTQFAEYGKGMLPFWYAEENFMKRWTRGLIDEGPAMIRKAQLGYMGLKEAGVVRTDEEGRDWFVYPGSGALIDTMSRLFPGIGTIVGGVMFQTPTDSMFPGLSTRFGQPSFTPLVTIPIDLVTNMFPELVPAQRALLGDFASDRNVIESLVPATVTNLYSAITSSPESSAKYSAAVNAALAQMEAEGQIPDNLTAMQMEEVLDRARDHGRIIMLAQVLTGFTAPGPPSPINAGSSANFTGIGIDDPAGILRARYLSYVRDFGIEQGTINFLARFPDATLEDVVNPMAYTQGRTESVSGAPLSATEEALQWYTTNSDYLHQLPNAGPWLLPVDTTNERSQYAQDQLLGRGLRTRVAPEEFLRSMKFRTAAGKYFKMQRAYNDAIAEAGQQGNRARVNDLTTARDYELLVYRSAHPVFAEELQSSDGRERRNKVLEEMRVVVNDNLAPRSEINAEQIDGLRAVMTAFDDYKVRLATMSNNRSAAGRAEVEFLKQQFGNWARAYVSRRPSLAPFWNAIIEPEASLD